MRIVYITLEYCAPDLFSGNGICARSQVRGLAKSAQVHVVCGRPHDAEAPEQTSPNIKVTPVSLNTWFTTDRNSSHEAFARGAACVLDEVDWTTISACLAVDWTGMNAVHAMTDSSKSTLRHASVPVIYLSFRVYMSMTGILDSDRSFYKRAEGNAVRSAVATGGGVVALSDDDARALNRLTDDPTASIRVVHPMLREEFSTIAAADRGKILDFGRKRLYLVSLVRLSEDKGAHRFVQLLSEIQKNDSTFWDRTGVVPLICGAASQPLYAEKVKRKLKECVPNAVIVDRFLAPKLLAQLLQNAVLNVHPALYEAYGLTIVEAAAMGCPSIVNSKGIGAAQLLTSNDGAVETVDMADSDAFAKSVKRLLEDHVYRAKLAYQAFMKATSWGEDEHVATIERFTRERIAECKQRKTQSTGVG